MNLVRDFRSNVLQQPARFCWLFLAMFAVLSLSVAQDEPETETETNSASADLQQQAADGVERGKEIGAEAIEKGRELTDEAIEKGKVIGEDAIERGKEIGQEAAETSKAWAEEASVRGRELGSQASELGKQLSDSAAPIISSVTDSAVELGKSIGLAIERQVTGKREIGGITVYDGRRHSWRKPKGDPTVLLIPIEGEVDSKTLNFIRMALSRVEDDERIAAVALQLDTEGGDLRIVGQILALLRDSPVPIYAYVDNKIDGGGVMLSYAAQDVYVAPDATIGSLSRLGIGSDDFDELDEDEQSRSLAWQRAAIRSLSEENGHIPRVGQALIEPGVGLTVGDREIVGEDRVLVMTATEATSIVPPLDRPLFAQAVLDSADQLPIAIEMPDATLETFKLSGTQSFAQALLILSPLLITAFVVGIYVEFNTPGIGLAGGVSAIALALFVVGQFMIGYSTAWEPLIIFVALVLIAVEVFVIPGFGVAGIGGIITLVIGVLLMMIPEIKTYDIPGMDDPLGSVRWDYLETAFIRIGVGLGAGGLAVAMAARFLPQSAMFNSIALRKSQRREDGYVSFDVDARNALIGQRGQALTDLHPAGIISIDGTRHDVVSAGEFIYKGDWVTVVEVNGPRIAVAPSDPPDDDG